MRCNDTLSLCQRLLADSGAILPLAIQLIERNGVESIALSKTGIQIAGNAQVEYEKGIRTRRQHGR